MNPLGTEVELYRTGDGIRAVVNVCLHFAGPTGVQGQAAGMSVASSSIEPSGK